jgi:hypothetical protein
VPFAVLVAVSFALPSPFNTVAVFALLGAAVVVLAGPALGVGEALWGFEADDGGDRTAKGRVEGDGADGFRLGRLTATLALFTVAFAGLYMLLANYGLTFFTGKNVYLLGLDSVGDTLESLALLGTAALALGLESEALGVESEVASDGPVGGEDRGVPDDGVAGLPARGDDEWWRHEGEER